MLYLLEQLLEVTSIRYNVSFRPMSEGITPYFKRPWFLRDLLTG